MNFQFLEFVEQQFLVKIWYNLQAIFQGTKEEILERLLVYGRRLAAKLLQSKHHRKGEYQRNSLGKKPTPKKHLRAFQKNGIAGITQN
jgi:hypothetical protein